MFRKLYDRLTARAYEDGWNEGINLGVQSARYLIERDLRRIGSTGDYFEAKWDDVMKVVTGAEYKEEPSE